MSNRSFKTYRYFGGLRIWDMDRNAHKRFPFNWTQWLAMQGPSVKIASVTFILGANVTSVQTGNDLTTASILVQLADANLPDMQVVTCRISTNESPPQVQDCSIWINPVDE